MRKRINLFLAALLLGCGLTGCAANRTPVFVLQENEIVPLDKGQHFVAPYRGVFYSEEAESRVMEAKRIPVVTK